MRGERHSNADTWQHCCTVGVQKEPKFGVNAKFSEDDLNRRGCRECVQSWFKLLTLDPSETRGRVEANSYQNRMQEAKHWQWTQSVKVRKDLVHKGYNTIR